MKASKAVDGIHPFISMAIDDTDPQSIERSSVAWHGQSIQVSSKLDLSTVKTSFPRHLDEPRGLRPFGLENCPTFFPTSEEFKDALAYIRSISNRASDYGICKIVPPMGWQMPFVTDTEVILIISSLFIHNINNFLLSVFSL